jgi:hypothetical protein
MTTFTELLTGTRSQDRRGYYWNPCPAGCPASGRLEVTRGRKGTAYLVVEVYPSPGFGSGRAFTLRKVDGTVYHAFLADDRPHSTCDCPGHSYAAAEKADRRHGDHFDTLGCVHLDALASLIWNNWLPESRTNAEADVGATETTDQELPECFKGCHVIGCPF